jgi:hypothetical protein
MIVDMYLAKEIVFINNNRITNKQIINLHFTIISKVPKLLNPQTKKV